MEVRRDSYLNRLLEKRGNGLVKVVIGMRRCGKSYLLFKLFKERLLAEQVAEDHIIETSFDDYENQKFRDPEVFYPYVKERISDKGQYYVLLDEVQLLGEFVPVLNGLARKSNVDVYVTGSNAKFLSSDVVTEFRGRGDVVHMYPLTFAEYMSVYPGDRLDGWRDYVLYGGLPLIFSFPTPEGKSAFLKSLFEETYIADIIGRNNVRNREEFEELLNIVSSSVGSLTNPHKLSKTFQSVKNKTISQTTIKRYLDYLRDSFLVDSAIQYDVKGRKYIDAPLKYYFTDLGLRNARLNFRQVEETHAMENVIFNELKFRGLNVDVGVVPISEKSKDGKSVRKRLEIDFVCNQGSKRYYIQSAFAMYEEAKKQQEQRPLMRTGDAFKKIIISKEVLGTFYNDDGVLVMNLFDFLLNPDSLSF